MYQIEALALQQFKQLVAYLGTGQCLLFPTRGSVFQHIVNRIVFGFGLLTRQKTFEDA